MKIVLVGPVKPYRGGIAHFNDCLYAEIIQQGHEVQVYSWKQRYPSFLYPGKSQFDKKEKDILKEDPRFVLSIYNPFTWIRTARKIKKYNADLVIYNWVTPFLAPVIYLISLFQSREKNVLICHNVLPHERRWIDVPLSKLVFSRMSHFIVHAEKELEMLKKMIPGARASLGFHPRYSFFTANRSIEDIRSKYDIDGDRKILLYFGYVRPYKGLEYLIQSMSSILESRPVHLFIVGEIWEGKQEYLALIDRLGLNECITVIDEYVPDEEVGNYFEAADLVILPYVSATQSGIAKIAFSFAKPVITTRVGGLIDLPEEYPDCVLIVTKSHQAISTAVVAHFESETDHQENKLVKDEKTWSDYVALLTA